MRAIVSFVVVFIFAFVLGGWYLMPYLPPTPDHPLHALELEYWKTNWAGVVLGLILGSLSAWSVVRSDRKAAGRKASDSDQATV